MRTLTHTLSKDTPTKMGIIFLYKDLMKNLGFKSLFCISGSFQKYIVMYQMLSLVCFLFDILNRLLTKISLSLKSMHTLLTL